MDVTDIGKVASRKRMSTDAEKLREKVSRETAKIIKLKVAQDTAYWDLKERLQQLQGAHERLQQNMVDVQMQHEAASARYTQELGLRPDTLNKVAGVRGVCSVLEEYGARLRQCVARSRADGAALQAAYAACGARVRRLANELTRARDRAAAALATARESGARATDVARQLTDARDQLAAAHAVAVERGARLRQADDAAAAMRDELARLLQQLEVRALQEQQSGARLELEARAAREEAARRAQEAAERAAELRATQAQLEEAQNAIQVMKQTEATHFKEIKNLETVIHDKNKYEKEIEAEMRHIKERLGKLETENLEASEQLVKSEQECAALRAALTELSRDAEQLRDTLTAERLAQRAERDADAARIDELGAAAAAKDRELDANTGTIAGLMTDLKSESDARARADSALQVARRQHDAELQTARSQHHSELQAARLQHDNEMQAARTREQQLRDNAARLEQAVKAKDDELGAQMTIILDMRGEKERLQERIQGMQNMIDNIQKELTGRLAAPRDCSKDCGEEPEQDAAPRQADLYSFLSDDSVDGDALDRREVGRRFEALARGHVRERLRVQARGGLTQGSISLSQLKDDLKMKSRTFFKNKRFDGKSKKFK